MYFILSFLLIGIGTLMLLFPQAWFDLTESWKSHSASEPSDWYIFSTRFGGMMCALAGIAYIVVNLVL